MDTTPIYDLRSRLRAAAIAGTSLLAEDFRLKRAAEAIKPLEASAPVFAKIGQMMNMLLGTNCANPTSVLLDTLTLVDAVICTLGTVEVKGSVEPLAAEYHTKNIIVNAPYSILKNLIDALTTSGSGHFNYVYETHENNLELFHDYRVRHAMVQGLNASYTDLADMVETWMEEEDETILPLLMKDFDPKGKKEMVRRVHVIEAVAKERANDFYIKMLETAEKDVRQAFIHALQYTPENIELLFDMIKTEKGKNKQAAMGALAMMEDERAYEFFKEMMEKKPAEALKYIQNVSTKWSSKLLPEIFHKTLLELDKLSIEELKGGVNGKCTPDKATAAIIEVFNYCILALLGKGGEDICECYWATVARKDKLNRLKPAGVMNFTYLALPDLPRQYYEIYKMYFEKGIGVVLYHSLMINPDASLKELAFELYNGKGENQKNVYFLSAAVIAKLVECEDCTSWLEEQLVGNKLTAQKIDKERLKAIQEALSHVYYCEKRNDYVFRIQNSNEKPVSIPYSREIIAWMMSHANKEMDAIIFHWLSLHDEEQCKQMGAWFYERARSTSENRIYLRYMKQCGWTDCKGLGVQYVKNNLHDINEWSIHNYLIAMPGGDSVIAEEARAIYNAIQSGEIRTNKVNMDTLDRWIMEWSRG